MRVPLRVLLEASWGLLGASWGPLGGLLGASWGPLGGLLGGLVGEGELEPSWRAPGGLLGPSGGPLKKYKKQWLWAWRPTFSVKTMVFGLEANFYYTKPWLLLS